MPSNLTLGNDSVLPSRSEAIQWCLRNAAEGDSHAMCFLGVCYYEGDGVPQDLTEAYCWFNVAAALGNRKARKHRDRTARSLSQGTLEIAQGRARALFDSIDARVRSSDARPARAPDWA